jgi:hypothetical protein
VPASPAPERKVSDELERRASDDEREQTVARLREASAEGRLTLEELADRTALAYSARSHAELEPLTADLPAAAPVPERRSRHFLVSAFGPLQRSGRRALADETVVISLFGPATLDLRDSTFAAGATISVVSLFGPVFLTIPEHVEVDVSVHGIFGPVHDETRGEVPPGAPRLSVRGLGLFGPVFVRTRRR